MQRYYAKNTKPQVCQETGLELPSALDRDLHHSTPVRSFHQELQGCCYAWCMTKAHSKTGNSRHVNLETWFMGHIE